MKGTIISEIAFYKRFLLKMLFLRKWGHLCTFRDLLIYSKKQKMNLFDFILIFDLSIDELYGIISANKFISKPGASR